MNPCEWCNKTSEKIDSLEFEVEDLKDQINLACWIISKSDCDYKLLAEKWRVK